MPKETKFVRVNQEIYDEVERLAQEGYLTGSPVSTTLMTNILLGVALNRVIPAAEHLKDTQ